MLRIVSFKLVRDFQAVAEIDTVRTRIRRAARALDEVVAALSRTNGRDAVPSPDTIEFVSEAFDRELLYLMAVFDGQGRAFVSWLDPTPGGDLRKSLASAKTLDDYVSMTTWSRTTPARRSWFGCVSCSGLPSRAASCATASTMPSYPPGRSPIGPTAVARRSQSTLARPTSN